MLNEEQQQCRQMVTAMTDKGKLVVLSPWALLEMWDKEKQQCRQMVTARALDYKGKPAMSFNWARQHVRKGHFVAKCQRKEVEEKGCLTPRDVWTASIKDDKDYELFLKAKHLNRVQMRDWVHVVHVYIIRPPKVVEEVKKLNESGDIQKFLMVLIEETKNFETLRRKFLQLQCRPPSNVKEAAALIGVTVPIDDIFKCLTCDCCGHIDDVTDLNSLRSKIIQHSQCVNGSAAIEENEETAAANDETEMDALPAVEIKVEPADPEEIEEAAAANDKSVESSAAIEEAATVNDAMEMDALPVVEIKVEPADPVEGEEAAAAMYGEMEMETSPAAEINVEPADPQEGEEAAAANGEMETSPDDEIYVELAVPAVIYKASEVDLFDPETRLIIATPSAHMKMCPSKSTFIMLYGLKQISSCSHGQILASFKSVTATLPQQLLYVTIIGCAPLPPEVTFFLHLFGELVKPEQIWEIICSFDHRPTVYVNHKTLCDWLMNTILYNTGMLCPVCPKIVTEPEFYNDLGKTPFN